MLHHLPHQLDKDIRVSKKTCQTQLVPNPGSKAFTICMAFYGSGNAFHVRNRQVSSSLPQQPATLVEAARPFRKSMAIQSMQLLVDFMSLFPLPLVI